MKKAFITLIALLLSLAASASATVQYNGLWYSIYDNSAKVISCSTGNSGDIVIPSRILDGGVYYDVTSIDRYAFSDCSGLTSISIPNSVTYIGECAFEGCTNLTSISIPNSNIGECAFEGCTNLSSVAIGSGVTFIDVNAFKGCNSLKAVHITDLSSWCKIHFEYNGPNQCSNPLQIANHLYLNGVEIKNLIIPNSVTSIGEYAFEGCSGLTSVTIPNSVTSIGHSAFWGCSGLTSISIPNSVTSIGSGAFSGTGWYNNQPDGLIYVGNFAYEYKGTMPDNTSITIKDGTVGIVGSAFSSCSGLTSITIPNSVRSIGNFAFYGCSSLTSIVTEIENPFVINDNVFYYYDKDIYATATLIVPPGKRSAYQNTAGWKKFQNIVEVGGVGYEFEVDGIKYRVGQNNTLSVISKTEKYSGSVVIPESISIESFGKTYSVTSIGGSAFAFCRGLTSVTIPNSVTNIGELAFEGCSGLSSVTIGNGVTYIDTNAFKGCNNLISVYITDLAAWCKIYFEYSGLNQCSNPLQIANHLYLNGVEIKDLIIPNDVTSIGPHAFYGWSGLKSITIPNNVTSIYWGAFWGCSGLTSVIIPSSVTLIDGSAFRDCSGLTTIVSEIENPFVISDNVFYCYDKDIYATATLIVPPGKKSAYQNTAGWNKFTKITEAADKDEVAFTNDGISYQGNKSERNIVVMSVDTKQTSIEIPASISYDGITYLVTGIADDAFKGSHMGALIWNIEAALPNNAFSNASIGSNFLLYVKSASYAPSTVKNVVVEGTAQKVVLSDNGGQFYCPQTFIARSISYTHNYTMETGGNGKGWESLALPFFVQKISHNTRGEIVPFALYSSGSSQKPFWLAKFSGNEFKRTSAIEANEPYIIAMPNNKNYRNDYNLAGEVTFSAENAAVPKTPTFDGAFVPAFTPVTKSSSVKALNNASYSGGYDPGSCFIPNLRDVHPFEAYMTGNSSRGIIEINYDNGTTDVFDILFSTDDAQDVTIYTLGGLQVSHTTQHDFDAVWQQLPKGIYLVNGNKRIK